MTTAPLLTNVGSGTGSPPSGRDAPGLVGVARGAGCSELTSAARPFETITRPLGAPPAARLQRDDARVGRASRIETSASWWSRAFVAESCCETATSANTMAAAMPATAKPHRGRQPAGQARALARRGCGRDAPARARRARRARRRRCDRAGRRDGSLSATASASAADGLERVLVGAAAVVARRRCAARRARPGRARARRARSALMSAATSSGIWGFVLMRETLAEQLAQARERDVRA